MGTLHGRLNGMSSDPILAAKGVREALRSLRMPDPSFTRASALVEVAQARGLVLVATHGDESALIRAQGEGQRASNGHMAFYVNMRPEAQASYTTPEQRALRAVPGLPTPIRPETPPPAKAEPNAAATMAIMMAMNNGNPLVAGAHCRNLARTTTAPVFVQAEALLTEAFPWIKAKLDSGEIA